MWTLAVLSCLLAGSLGFMPRDKKAPEWSPVYTVKGTITIPYSEIAEPFYAWFDSKNGKSRIDYYGGMAKTYQLDKSAFKPYGANVKVVPVTTETALNQLMCLQSNGSAGQEVSVQTVLPDLSKFKYIGTENLYDSETAKWSMTETFNDKVNKYTMWIKYKKNLRGDSIPIPVRYEMKGYNSLLGSHYDHYYLDYSEYDVNTIDPNVFNIDDSLQCTGFPGPGAHHASFNPMMTYVHPRREEYVDDEFHRFKTKHNKHYGTVPEHEMRLNIFRHHLRLIDSHNRRNVGYTLAVNHLADRTDDELAVLRGRRHSGAQNEGLPFPYSESQIKKMSTKIPDEFDWRLFGAVTRVKDQSICGSCWSFGTVGAVEGALFLHNGGQLVTLSQQALVDCSWGFGNNGCDGGEDYRAYQWIIKHGLPTDEDYGGYLGQDGYCHIDNVTIATSMKGWVNVSIYDEAALKLAIFKHGPVSVAIDASHKTFTYYSHGVYYEPDCSNAPFMLDHAVLAVGFGVMDNQKYWLIKNSWSNMWGNDGYILMAMKDNNCGVTAAATYVLI